ncbi:hypothetical protein [Stenotrophomonas oahuensis]|uniref:Transmembrane protein n=1 Tax=Stenotrophomonas oahuensis TaxID=3003271 RepID=A0ABY9YU34_9GAMM|nr:hypothetical protein [Stenotrophomonas sp. A5586]WNH54213.1 hypothetical protein PDM29_08045 [Stenotrophomonas sp. A5586]
MQKWKASAVGVVAVLAIVISGGYGLAWRALPDCVDPTFQDVQRRGVTGLEFGGRKVALGRADVVARIEGPFLVETMYFVPFDLHGTTHVQRYLILPWGLRQIGTKAYHYVDAGCSHEAFRQLELHRPESGRCSVQYHASA